MVNAFPERLKRTGTQAKHRPTPRSEMIFWEEQSDQSAKYDVIQRLTSRIAMSKVSRLSCACYFMSFLCPTKLQAPLYFTERSHVLGTSPNTRKLWTIGRENSERLRGPVEQAPAVRYPLVPKCGLSTSGGQPVLDLET